MKLTCINNGNFARMIVFVGLFFVATFSGIAPVAAEPDQGADIEVIEYVLFKITRMPSSRSDGLITLRKDPPEGESRCSDCEIKLRFSQDLKIRIAGQTSRMTLQHLSLLPPQKVTAQAKEGRLLSIGMSNVDRGTAYTNDL